MANKNTPRNLGPLKDLAAHLVQCGLASNTRKSYKLASEKLSNFRLLYGLKQTWPIPVTELLNFIAFMASENLAPSTITAYISGLSYFHKIQDLEDTTKSFIVGKAIEGLRRSKGSQKDLREPITVHMLDKFIKKSRSYCSSFYEASMFSAAFSLAFFGLLRISEFTSTLRSTSSLNKQIQIQDVTIKNNAIKMLIRWSKTQQRGNPVNLTIPAIGKTHCPVANLAKYLNIRPRCNNNNLFIHSNHSSLSSYQFKQVLNKALEFSGISNVHIRSHSFRIGGASYFSQKGVSQEKIMKLGRWKSHAFKRYIRL